MKKGAMYWPGGRDRGARVLAEGPGAECQRQPALERAGQNLVRGGRVGMFVLGLLALLSACGSKPSVGCRASTYNPALRLESADLAADAHTIFHQTLIAQGFKSTGNGGYSRENFCESRLFTVNTETEYLVELALFMIRPYENSQDHIRTVNAIVAGLEAQARKHPRYWQFTAVTRNDSGY